MLNEKKFIIYTPSYNEKSGGIVVLHKLCHILNDLGYEAYLYPQSEQFVFDKKSIFSEFRKFIKFELKSLLTGFKVNPHFDTPIFDFKNKEIDDSCIVFYSELVLGNPLGAKQVARWLLHQPGFHTGRVMYNAGEILFKFNSAVRDFNYPGSITSTQELKVIHYPLEHYNLDDVKEERQGTAYCLRKGKHKAIVHDLKDSVLIDDLPHEEVAKVFKSVKTFISYDTYTAYSLFAVLCGCESVVIPDEGVTEEEWYPNPEDRNGIAYGMENIEKANSTAHLVKQYVISEEDKSFNNVKLAIEEMLSHWS
ncbi:WavQ [Pseudoalteromonas sp. SSDWG2]|uniref:WavQ n=1 Tax=Pseudoalteromonas sp. SSDWG2 TaxID=3139391 RepID=UPI003BAB0025